jgi:hypothetical protein
VDGAAVAAHVDVAGLLMLVRLPLVFKWAVRSI